MFAENNPAGAGDAEALLAALGAEEQAVFNEIQSFYNAVEPSEWEIVYIGDDDGDGLNTPDEMSTHRTDPLDDDSDDDGLNDGEEITAGTDPNNTDSDGDGLADGAEVATHGTDPLVADTDLDGASDGTEIELGTDPLDDASVPPTQTVQPSFRVTLLDNPDGLDVAPNEQVDGLTYREDHHPGGRDPCALLQCLANLISLIGD